MRNSAVVAASTIAVSPSTRPGGIAAWPAGSTSRANALNPFLTRLSRALNQAGLAEFRATGNGQDCDGQVTALRPGDARPEPDGLAGCQFGEVPGCGEHCDRTSHLPVLKAQESGRNISRPPPRSGLSSAAAVIQAVSPNRWLNGW